MNVQKYGLWLLLSGALCLLGCEVEEPPTEQEAPVDAGLDTAASDAPEMGATADSETPNCVPSQTEYETVYKDVLDAHCVHCHGEPLQFGAVHSFVNYDVLLAPATSGRAIDLIVGAVSSGAMPPAGQTPLGTQLRQDLVNWASCGQAGEVPEDPVNPGGAFDANRPVLADPGGPPEGTDFFELRADNFVVPADATDRYECFYFEAPVDEERFIRRIETVQDDSRVLHHTILIPGAAGEVGTHGSCDDDNPLSLIYGWAPGQGALHFEDGGIRLTPGQKFSLQIHYNNAAGHTDVSDSSGVRIYHGPTEGPEVSMLTFGPLGFAVPPNSTKTVEGWCRLPTATKLLFSFPHMHEAGIGFNQVLEPAEEGGAERSVVTLDGWDFGSQYIYETPMELAAGDIIRTECTFRNTTDRRLRFGPNTADEMCFNFAYVSPPPPVTFCNQNDRPIAYEYTPGECASPDAADVSAPPVFTPFVQGTAPVLQGGDRPDGFWVLSDAKLFLPSLDLGGFTLDTVQSRVTALGTVAFDAGSFYFDASTEIHAVASGVSFDSARPITFNGPITFSEEDPGALTITPECGELPADDGIRFGYNEDKLIIVAPSEFGPLQLELMITFDRQAPSAP